MRRANLGALLRVLHFHGPQSRSQIAGMLGVNRSTVAGLVAELGALQLVEELPPAATQQIGRPSPIVSPRPSLVALAVNPETDAVTIGLVDFAGAVLRRIRIETGTVPTPEEALRICGAVIEGMRGELDAHYRVAGIGVAVPGLVRAHDGLIRWAPHLEWRDEPFATSLSAATGYRAMAGNDASLGALAEHRFGVAREVDHVIFLNGGASGIGGGIIAGGLPFPGHEGYAGEWGHVMVATTSGALGPLEDVVNQAALLSSLDVTLGELSTIDETWRERAGGELPAVVETQLEALGVAISNAINVLNPQMVVLGGFLESLFRMGGASIRDVVHRHALTAAADGARIEASGLGEDRLLVGAAEMVFDVLIEDPAGTSTGR